MPVRKPSLPLVRRGQEHSPLIDDPPIGHLQALVLKKLKELGGDAYGYNVLEQLSQDAGVWMDPSQIYAAIRKLAGKNYIDHVETRKQEKRPPLKIYALTKEGLAALETTSAHHVALAKYLNKKGKVRGG